MALRSLRRLKPSWLRPALLTHRLFSTDEIRSAYGYCIDQVRKYDYDNYVWISQLPKDLRPTIFMLRAFNIDTALVADQVRNKESPLVQVRYQWWREGIAAAFKGSPPRHPVLIALRDVLDQTTTSTPTLTTSSDADSQGPSPQAPFDTAPRRGGAASPPSLKQYHFKRMVDAREEDALDTQPPLGVDGLEKYAEGTASQLLYLQLAAAGAGSRECDHAASHLGKAVGITALLRGTTFHASHRRSYIPVDMCVKHNVSQEDIYSGQCSEGLRDAVLGVASVAKGHLDEARALAKYVPKSAAAVLLPSLACESYLKALESANFDVFSPALQPRQQKGAPLSHVLRVKYHLFMGTY